MGNQEYLYTTLYIKNLVYQVTEEDIWAKLDAHNCTRGLKAIRLISDKMQGHFTGYCPLAPRRYAQGFI